MQTSSAPFPSAAIPTSVPLHRVGELVGRPLSHPATLLPAPHLEYTPLCRFYRPAGGLGSSVKSNTTQARAVHRAPVEMQQPM